MNVLFVLGNQYDLLPNSLGCSLSAAPVRGDKPDRWNILEATQTPPTHLVCLSTDVLGRAGLDALGSTASTVCL